MKKAWGFENKEIMKYALEKRRVLCSAKFICKISSEKKKKKKSLIWIQNNSEETGVGTTKQARGRISQTTKSFHR